MYTRSDACCQPSMGFGPKIFKSHIRAFTYEYHQSDFADTVLLISNRCSSYSNYMQTIQKILHNQKVSHIFELKGKTLHQQFCFVKLTCTYFYVNKTKLQLNLYLVDVIDTNYQLYLNLDVEIDTNSQPDLNIVHVISYNY